MHHKAAARYHREAAEYHYNAAICYKDGDIDKALYNARIAQTLHELVKEYTKEILRINYL
jgi:hypothetical protein